MQAKNGLTQTEMKDAVGLIQFVRSNRPAGGRRLSTSQFCRARSCICRISPRSRSPKGVSEYSTCGRFAAKSLRRTAPSSSSSRSWAVSTFWLMPGSALHNWACRRGAVEQLPQNQHLPLAANHGQQAFNFAFDGLEIHASWAPKSA